MPRYFTLLEAEDYLPELEQLLRACKEAKRGYEEADAEISAFTRRITLSGGMVVSTGKVGESKRRKGVAAAVLQGSVQRFEQIGCLLKDLETGLMDFPTLYRGKEVYLCWKLGESGISFWHQIEDGFRGRRPIDSEFLQNHAAA